MQESSGFMSRIFTGRRINTRKDDHQFRTNRGTLVKEKLQASVVINNVRTEIKIGHEP